MSNTEAVTKEKIKEFWEMSSLQTFDSAGLKPTARDPFLQQTIEDIAFKYVSTERSLIDLGCGDGSSTLKLSKRLKSAVGVDYIERYVEKATEYALLEGAKNTKFIKADVLQLSTELKGALFDIALSFRCLINLSTWDEQKIALREIASSIVPDGLYILSEGWQEGLDGLNLRRARLGLSPISSVSYNKMINKSDFEREVSKYFKIEDYVSTGLYIYISRIVQPLLVSPNQPRHDHPLNQVAAFIQKNDILGGTFVDCDYSGVYILRKK